jgi:hypothetical protein
MNQPTHIWIAARALALLGRKNPDSGLVKLLTPNVCEASTGAWVPDTTELKASSGSFGSHVFRMTPYGKPDPAKRFVTTKDELLARLGAHRRVGAFISEHDTLSSDWWNTPFKGDAKPGEHIPNRAMAVSTMLKDLLLLGNEEVELLTGRQLRDENYIETGLRSIPRAVAGYFFMLSHFIADGCMPCHCDGRRVMFTKGEHETGSDFHSTWEAHWGKRTKVKFGKDKLLKTDAKKKDVVPVACAEPTAVLAAAEKLDDDFGIEFAEGPIPDLQKGNDVWLEMVNICRGTFAVAHIIAPLTSYDYDYVSPKPSAKELFANVSPVPMEETDSAVLHDAVLNTAIIWQRIWRDATGKKS